MDPKANLEQQLSAAREVIAAVETPPWVAAGATSDEWGDEQDRADYFEGVAEQGRGLAELVLALDEWRRNGGFDPSTTIAQMTTNAIRYYNTERLEREIAFARAALDESDDGTILWLAAVLTEQERRAGAVQP